MLIMRRARFISLWCLVFVHGVPARWLSVLVVRWLHHPGTRSALRQVRNALISNVKRASNVSSEATAKAPT